MIILQRILPLFLSLAFLFANSSYANCGPNCPDNCQCGCATGKCPPNCKCGCDMPNKGNAPKPVTGGNLRNNLTPQNNEAPQDNSASQNNAEQQNQGNLTTCPCGSNCPKDSCNCGCNHGYMLNGNAACAQQFADGYQGYNGYNDQNYADNYSYNNNQSDRCLDSGCDNCQAWLKGDVPYHNPNCPFTCEDEDDNTPIEIILSAVNEDHSQECGYKPYDIWGQWFPDNPVLFRQFMADPRALIFSAAWRFNDQALFKNTIPVSYYDTCVFYRWYNVWPWNGALQIELEGCLWAVFNPLGESSPLINADYYIGFPLTYAVGPWAFRLRGFHISSHIGDEFLLQHPYFIRRNPSAEYLDFFISYDYTDEIRFYSGLGYIVAQDDSFIQKRFYSAVGAELRLLELGFVDCCQRVYGAPIFGMHFRQQGDFGRRVDATYILGYEFGKLTGEYKKLRFYLEYHDGYSVEGQFSRLKTNYLAIKMTYGY